MSEAITTKAKVHIKNIVLVSVGLELELASLTYFLTYYLCPIIIVTFVSTFHTLKVYPHDIGDHGSPSLPVPCST